MAIDVKESFSTFREPKDWVNNLSEEQLDTKIGNGCGGGELDFSKAEESDGSEIYIF